ncbi:RagB/SusD family nutrient uptake outer membrane protein [Membranihabitans maritimus]|uniref:RagB/SusD family nutrient uptake outer membrane protein n=1 Tax=Membranihabitans maritimus TaxID=2904244 RepID=UPI001F29A8C7|nr:RagB/SusD family nutrient uptake outer membrane protein [Membranihabitans maritimus]
MKIINIFYAFFFIVIFTSCDYDYLNRQPLSDVSPEAFFQSEKDLDLYTNSFYSVIPDATGIYNEADDNIVKTGLADRIKGTRITPTSGGGWSWGELRKINYFLQNYANNGLSEEEAKPYLAEARFFRAWFYFEKVKTFGDVPIYTEVIAANDDESLYKSRDSRIEVMDFVMSDLDYAIANLASTRSVDKITKWTALALKSRVGLFEGTFRKYHTEMNLPGYEIFLNEAVEAARELMESGTYSIYKSSPETAYKELFASYDAIDEEVILARKYSADLQLYHNVNYYTITASYGKPGLEKSLVNSYLMQDGSRFTDQEGFNELLFPEEVKNRDLRLSQTIRTPGYSRIGQTTVLPADFGASVTGYQLTKFVTATSEDSYNRSYNDIPVFRYAEVLLNFAEAKAELGTLTQADLDQSIALVRERVAMPNIQISLANSNPDPYISEQYPNVSGENMGVILEIRRERRIELVMESYRWDDILRWKVGPQVVRQFKGMYFPGTGTFDLDENGSIDVVIYTGEKPTEKGPIYLQLGSEILLENGENGGLVIINPNIPKTFDESKDYFYPLPIQDLLINDRLEQNPGWQN